MTRIGQIHTDKSGLFPDPRLSVPSALSVIAFKH